MPTLIAQEELSPPKYQLKSSTSPRRISPQRLCSVSENLPLLSIDNYVCSANLAIRFDLQKIISTYPKKAEYLPKKQCIMLKLIQPKSSALLFASGKLVCTGGNSEESIKQAARKFTRIIQKMDYPGVSLIDFKVQNIVASCDVGFRIQLEELYYDNSSNCTYEPELYPALVYNMSHPSLNVLLFSSGKIVFSGSKNEQAIQIALAEIHPIAKAYKDNKKNITQEINNEMLED